MGLKLPAAAAHPFVLVTERLFLSLCCASLYLSAFSLWPANFIHLKDVLAVELNKEETRRKILSHFALQDFCLNLNSVPLNVSALVKVHFCL